MDSKNLLLIVTALFLSGCGFYKTYDGMYTNRKETKNATIFVVNKSFEFKTDPAAGNSACGEQNIKTLPPEFWSNCEDPGSVYLLDGAKSKYHKYALKAWEGKYYAGLAANSDGTVGILSQELSSELIMACRYQIELYVAFAERYRHCNNFLKNTGGEVNTPGILRIWGSDDGCELNELYFESTPITNTDWGKIRAKFVTRYSHKFIVFEIGFQNGMLPYDTNVLIDNISNIKMIH